MKYMFVSDIHGNLENLEKCVEVFNEIKADKLIILGDTAGGYYDDNNQALADILNNLGKKVEVIRGNCDTQEFEDLLDFELFDDDMLFLQRKAATNSENTSSNTEKNSITFMGKWLREDFDEVPKDDKYIRVSITHGHKYSYENTLPPNCGEIFIQGHTHRLLLVRSGNRIFANPGSVTKPRGTDLKCYILLDEESIKLLTLDGKLINEIFLNSI